MKPIFEISKTYLELVEQIETNEGEITPEIETALAINEGEIKQKGVAYVAVIKTMESDIKTIDDEIKRLTALKNSRSNIVLNLKDRLQYALELFSIEEIKTELVKINFRKSKSVIVDDIDKLPESCKKTTVSITPDKKAIKDYLDKGQIVNGAHIQENKNLQIK